MDASKRSTGDAGQRPTGLNYKFQRLREKIRKAVESGELSGKLPGERALARRFHVNAKTLSKALTDLAAEGVLDRSIGRGTYVKGSAPATSVAAGRWLVLCDGDSSPPCTVDHLRRACPEMHIAAPSDPMRPSFINQFAAVIDLAADTPESFLRDLIIWNIPVLAVNHEPQAYSMPAVIVDVALGVYRLGRDLLLAGHRRLAAIDGRGGSSLAETLRRAAARYAPHATVEAGNPSEAASLAESGITALVCGSGNDAHQARLNLQTRAIDVPARVSLTAIGCACPAAACSGYFVDCRKIADAVLDLLRHPQARPVTLWLPGTWIDRGSLAPTGGGLPLDRTAELRVSGVNVW